MRRQIRVTMLAASVIAGAVTVAGVPGIAGATHAPAGTSRVTEIRTAAHDGYDRLVFQLSGALPDRTFITWAPQISRDGSGDTVPASGGAFLQIGLNGVTALTQADTPTYGPTRRSVGLPNLNEVVSAGEFEGMASFGASVLARTSFTTFTLSNPSRVVIDIRSDYPRVSTPVHLVDQARFAAGTAPYTRAASRQAPAGAPAGGALNRLFAGPTAAESAAGLRTVASGATGFTGLTISGGIARVRLVGGCSSGGSTLTVADQIIPTLKAFPSVRWVKIYSPAGTTARPDGNSDSIPTCLEP